MFGEIPQKRSEMVEASQYYQAENAKGYFSGTLLFFQCFFPTDVGNLISGSSACSKTNLNIWKFTVHVLLKPGLENFKHYFTSM